MKISVLKQFREGVITKNPIFFQFIGLCPALAVTTSVIGALVMGAALSAVIIFSNLFISLIRKLIPDKIRVAAFIVAISGFTVGVELITNAFLPEIASSLGIYIPLIAVNTIVVAHADKFASENSPIPALIDGISVGIGFTFALACIAAVRELIGTGKLFAHTDGTGGLTVFGSSYPGAAAILLPAGAFITVGFILALANKLKLASDGRKARKQITATDTMSAEEISEVNENE